MIYPNKPRNNEYRKNSELSEKEILGTLGAHDPSIFKDGEDYYVFSTDAMVNQRAPMAIQIRKSKDLINWEYVGTAIDEIPKEAKRWTGAQGLWAPEVIMIDDEYYLYYCASSFGKNKSCIGLLKSKSIQGPWEDKGIVIMTDESDDRNAIDPNLILDKEGQLWMAYGSFWTGIYIVKLNKETGKLAFKDDFGKQIACRNFRTEGAIEGPYIIYNKEFNKYYLFVSYDSLSSDYNIRVGRADNIEGPYIDSNNNKMTDRNIDNPNNIGNKILGGYRFGDKEGCIAPGHNSVLNDDGSFYIVHHSRKEYNNNYFYMNVRKILWSNDGWPMVCPERFAGEREQVIKESDILGKWQFIILYKDVNRVLNGEEYEILSNKTIIGDKNGRWNISTNNDLEITLNLESGVEEYKGKVLPVWDWEEDKETLALTAISKAGEALWGKMKY